jgi:hypothetical protein
MDFSLEPLQMGLHDTKMQCEMEPTHQKEQYCVNKQVPFELGIHHCLCLPFNVQRI